MEKNIYNMELHECIDVDENCDVRRVPGGWIYIEYMAGVSITTTFVPFQNEHLTPTNKGG